ncbi:OST-HTH/LOTUS domain-containing protein [Ruminiclostridium sufflavum DSM 19573]|uniref:OST-HTH/LOTUS domain-containing protein n=1 Tax=Ruminiclostridium sufflavum DSM 19573 TaxID=1121337 RepID=A0A318XWA4_9FIRM|nr:NYN domain-containing protein [Ruminiclostridium sufflavum]PYG87077.1 OST-HTH/LOTUS domain-containing protein [Ruminiclostridium sufflavum DSM 19573]
MESGEMRFAVLIDAENVPYCNIKGIMEEIAKYGTPTIKRIYADWTRPTVSGWKNVLLENAITPIQQYSYTSGKNSSDSAMIIDAMDILYTEKVEGFCIISSDSDFTRLVIRLREAGMKVFGIGERKTPSPFIAACDKFTYIEIISASSHNNETYDNGPKKEGVAEKEQKSGTVAIGKDIINLIAVSINDVEDENGWAFLGDVGNLINKKQPDFDPRNFGFYKLTHLIKKLKEFEIEERDTNNSKIKHIYVRNKNNLVK